MANITFNISLFIYLFAALGYSLYLVYRRPLVKSLSFFSLGVGLLFHTVNISLRSMETGHGPYTTGFEITSFLAWAIVVIFFITEWKYKIQDLGAFIIPVVFLIFLYSAFQSREYSLINESATMFWLTMHRTLSIIGYAAFAIGFGVAVMYLIQENQVKRKKLGVMYFRMPSLEVLDNLNHKAIAFGFPLFTLGFMTGSIWNIKTDESLFSWDLFRTWPLIAVWLIYCGIFFGRLIVGWRGKKAAQGSILGFVTIVVSYFFHVV
jgi:cytochrome c-type biogenesis protein CcsB